MSTFSHLTDNAEGDTRAQTLPDAVKGDDVLTMMGKADTEQAKIQKKAIQYSMLTAREQLEVPP